MAHYVLTVPIDGVLTTRMEDFDSAGGAAVFCPDASGYIRWMCSINEPGELAMTINSEGGDINGADMLASALRYAAGEGWQITLTVDGLAASAAANLLLKAKDVARIRMRLGAQLMFHSCAAAVFGGAEAMRDAADGIDGYNAGIKQLLAKYTSIPAERTDEWFQEGRMGWLTAQEAVECGLADEILDGGAATPLSAIDDGAATAVAMWRRGIRVALMCRATKSEVEMAEQEDLKKEVKEEEVKEEVKEVKPEDDRPIEEIIEEVREELREQKKQNEEILARLAACEEERDDAERKVAKLTNGLKAQGASQASGKRWPELVREACEGKIGKAMDDAYLALKAKYPSEYQAYIGGKKSYHHI